MLLLKPRKFTFTCDNCGSPYATLEKRRELAGGSLGGLSHDDDTFVDLVEVFCSECKASERCSLN